MGREMGGRFKRDGIYVYLWLIHVEGWQKTIKFCKAIILQLKINKFLKKTETLYCQQSSLQLKLCFSSGHKQMWELDHKEGWVLKNRCFQIVVLEKTLDSPLDSKEIKSVNPKGNQSWMFIDWTDAETPILWPHDVKSWFIGKDPDAGKDWGY